MTRFLADECCNRELVHALRAAGHDVLFALEGQRTAPDEALLELANAEDRFLLTKTRIPVTSRSVSGSLSPASFWFGS